MVDPLLVGYAFVFGLVARLRGGRSTLLLLSPNARGARSLVRAWSRVLGQVVIRFPTSGDAQRVKPFKRADRAVGVGPAPSLLDEIRAIGLPALHIPNAVQSAPRSPDGRVIAVIGRLVARKRVDMILSAWADVAAAHADWTVSVVGSGQRERDDVEQRLRLLVDERQIPRVTFHGEVREPWQTIDSVGVFVIASEREGSPNAVLEALARGVPVVAPTARMEEWFSPAPPHIEFKDSADLVGALDELLGDASRREVLGRAGLDFLRVHHGVDETLRRWRDLLVNRPRTIARGGWAKVRIPVPADGLVLDVGSGRFPNERADVLCERYPRRGERLAVVDRPFVVADAGSLPFRDRAFAVAIASHLVEHVEDPRAVVGELARVGTEGYVETPHRRFERCLPESNHLWAIEVRNGALVCERNRWASGASSPRRRRLAWLYYAGETKSYPTLRLPGAAGRALQVTARAARAVLNRSGVATSRYRFGATRPATVVVTTSSSGSSFQ